MDELELGEGHEDPGPSAGLGELRLGGLTSGCRFHRSTQRPEQSAYCCGRGCRLRTSKAQIADAGAQQTRDGAENHTHGPASSSFELKEYLGKPPDRYATTTPARRPTSVPHSISPHDTGVAVS